MNTCLLKFAKSRAKGFRTFPCGDDRVSVSVHPDHGVCVKGPAIQYLTARDPQRVIFGWYLGHRRIKPDRQRVKDAIRNSWLNGWRMVV